MKIHSLRHSLIFVLGFAAITSASAATRIARPPAMYPVGKPTLECIYDSASYHRVPFEVLLAINSIERGNTGQKVGNNDGSYDNGAFQINSIHFARAKRITGATPYDIASKGCFNAEYAAMLLSEAIYHPKKQYEDFFTRAAGYHSWTTSYNNVYKKKLSKYTKDWATWLSNKGMQQTISPLYAVSYR